MIRAEAGMSAQDLCNTVREITLVDSDVQPYKDAQVSIERANLADFRPVSLYVLRKNLQNQLSLRASLLDQDIDPLHLEGSVNLDNDGYTVGLVPPIVEEDPEHGPILVDGTHRSYLGRSLGYGAINVLYIAGTHSDYPIYAFPNEWHEINEHDTVPTDPMMKKHYRPGDPRKLYRDLSSLNGSKQREAGSAA